MGFLRQYREEFRAAVDVQRDPRAARGCLGALAARDGAVQLESVTTVTVQNPRRAEIIRTQANAAIDSINQGLERDYPDCSGRLYLEENGMVLLRCGAQDCLLPTSDQI